ncbi:MAG: HEAT repeat domain-containing protein, partial [Myxococcota bacterium]
FWQEREGDGSTSSTRGQLRVDSLIAALQDGRSVVRCNAATGIGVLGADGASAARPLSTLLRDPLTKVRLSAAGALGKLGEGAVEVADALVGALADSDGPVSEAAAGSLAALGDDALPALLAGLETDDEGHARLILERIAVLPGAVDILFSALESPALNVQINAARGLGMLGADKVGERIALLESAQWIGDLRFRRAVRSALKALRD